MENGNAVCECGSTFFNTCSDFFINNYGEISGGIKHYYCIECKKIIQPKELINGETKE